MHPASAKFPPVDKLTDEQIAEIITRSEQKPPLLRSSREKSAWNERENRRKKS